MNANQLPASPSLAIPVLPVICEKCRATGFAGDTAFAAIPDILDFTPVPRRAHANGWTPEHQRAFVAALAITGSAKQAARAIGRHQFGAEQLRTAKGGRSFADAWDAAMDLARERETMRIHANLAELAEAHSQSRGLASTGSSATAVSPIHPECDYDPDVHTPDYPEYWEARRAIRQRFHAARRIFLACIVNEPDKRAAWETLCGAVDWDLATRFEAQPDEPESPNVHKPDTQLLAETGFLADYIGGEDNLGPIMRQLMAPDESAEAKANDGET